MKIYHATGFLRPGKRERWDLDRVLEQGIHQWQESLRAADGFAARRKRTMTLCEPVNFSPVCIASTFGPR